MEATCYSETPVDSVDYTALYFTTFNVSLINLLAGKYVCSKYFAGRSAYTILFYLRHL
jgi:hypothetical protein